MQKKFCYKFYTYISHIRRWFDLPEEAKKYILYIEKAIGCPIKYISVGQERNAYIER